MKRILKIVSVNILLITLFLLITDKLIYKIYNLNSPYIDLNSNDQFKLNERLVKFRENPINVKKKVQIPKDISTHFEYDEVSYETDNQGYIKPSRIYNNPDLKFFFLGGSTTENLYIIPEKRYPYLSTKMIENIFKIKINSFNAARSKNNSIHSLNLLINKILAEKPDFVFINHAVNDQHIFNLGSKYYWNIQNDRQIIIHPDKNFTIFKKIKVKIKNYFPGLYFQYLIIKNNYKDQDTRKKISNWDKLGKISDLKEYVNINKIFISLAEIYDFKIVFLTQPANFNIESDRSNLQTKYFIELTNFLNSKKSNNYYLIDLYSKMSKKSDYFYDNVHLNIKGNIKASEIISNFFKNNIDLTNTSALK